ncbi:hypothetical protein BD408DRAFT_427064 [Parasitella parasitica]|nr:hypothetical protein BD408DRAFT_427064 [Parasitella parasitica]
MLQKNIKAEIHLVNDHTLTQKLFLSTINLSYEKCPTTTTSWQTLLPCYHWTVLILISICFCVVAKMHQSKIGSSTLS